MAAVTDQALLAKLNASDAGPKPVTDPVTLGKLQYGIDFSQGIPAVRSKIAKLSDDQRQGALELWAQAFVANEHDATKNTQVTTAVRDLADVSRIDARGTFAGQWTNRLNAATNAIPHFLGMDGPAYDEALAYQNAQDNYVDTNAPMASAIGQIGGGALAMAASGGATAAPWLLRTALAGPFTAAKPAASLIGRAMQGAKMGGAFGANAELAHQQDLSNIGGDVGAALHGATIGGLVGGAAAPLIETGLGIGGALASRAIAAANPRGAAAAKLRDALAADFPARIPSSGAPMRLPLRGAVGNPILKPADNAMLSDPRGMLLDIGGINTKRLAKSWINTPNNEAATPFLNSLSARQAAQSGDLARGAQAGLGDIGNFEAGIAAKVAERSQTAKPLYEEAWKHAPATQLKNLDMIGQLINTPLGKTLVKRAQTEAANSLTPMSGMPLMKQVHIMKLQLDDMIQTARRGQQSSADAWNLRSLMDFKKRFLGAIDNKHYHTALETFAGDSKVLQAAELGAKEALKSTPYEIREALKKLSPSEAELYRHGAAFKLVDMLQTGSVMRDQVAGKLLSKKIQGRLRVLFPDIKSWRDFQRLAGVKGRQAKSYRFIQANSTTAQQLADMQESERPAAALAGAGMALASHGAMAAGHHIINGLSKLVPRGDPRVAAAGLRLLSGKAAANGLAAEGMIRQALSHRQSLDMLRRYANALAVSGTVNRR